MHVTGGADEVADYLFKQGVAHPKTTFRAMVRHTPIMGEVQGLKNVNSNLLLLPNRSRKKRAQKKRLSSLIHVNLFGIVMCFRGVKKKTN